jgi:hypothetical protein
VRLEGAGRQLVVFATLASVALVAVYLALGGSSYEPTPSADPCVTREWRSPGGIEETAQQFALSALDGAACELGVTREELAVALATEDARNEFAAERGIDDETLERAVRAGVIRGIDDAVEAEALSPLVATGLREVAERLPVDETIALIVDGRALFEDAEGLIGGLIDQRGGLLPDL